MGRIFQQTKMQMDANGDFPSLGGKTPISMGGLLPKHTKTRQNHGALQAEERMSRPRGFQDIGPPTASSRSNSNNGCPVKIHGKTRKNES